MCNLESWAGNLEIALILERRMLVSKTKIVIADDNEEILDLYKELLEMEFDVVAAAHDGPELLNAFKSFKPDVAIIDINMPEMSGFEVTRRIIEEDHNARIILLSAHKDRSMVEKGFSVGAKGFVLKITAGDDLVRAVYEISQGRTYISPSL
jgi:two-component system, NarL family, response regulator DegU